MSSTRSVTYWLEELKSNNPQAAQELWERYFHRLMGLARKHLRGSRRRAIDEEDVALCALDGFFRGVSRKRFPQLKDRNDLWKILVAITERKAFGVVQKEHRLKHGSGKVRGESLFGSGDGLGGFADHEPSPQFVVQFADLCDRLLRRLTKESLKRVALLKLEGWTNAEIAGKIARDEKTVERKLRLIRLAWDIEDLR
jgi:DNA-directed RNA polymerase specialized sigma24 family protein